MKYAVLLPLFFPLISDAQKDSSRNLLRDKELYKYEFCIYKEAKPGHVISNKQITIADTAVSVVKVQIMNGASPISYGTVAFTNKSDGKSSIVEADSMGISQMILPSGIYGVRFGCVGYSILTIDSLRLETGQLQEIKVCLGEVGGFVECEIQSKKQLTKKELFKKEQELTQKINGDADVKIRHHYLKRFYLYITDLKDWNLD